MSSSSAAGHSTHAEAVRQRYKLGRKLGEGTFGCVFRGHPLDGGPVVAIKLLKFDLDADDEDEAFEREVECLRLVQAEEPHPNIVHFIDHIGGDTLSSQLSLTDEDGQWSNAIILELGLHSLQYEIARVGGQARWAAFRCFFSVRTWRVPVA
jgi:serine/threonine protein kinase